MMLRHAYCPQIGIAPLTVTSLLSPDHRAHASVPYFHQLFNLACAAYPDNMWAYLETLLAHSVDCPKAPCHRLLHEHGKHII